MKTIEDNPPEEKNELIAKIKKIFKKKQNQNQNQNNYVNNWNTPEIHNLINADKVSFTQKEYDKLVQLFHHPLPNELRKDVFKSIITFLSIG